MTLDDLRWKTVLIIKTEMGYFAGWNQVMGRITWRLSAYDAWRTRDVNLAKEISEKIGGTLYLFNPVASKLKLYQEEQKAG